MCGSLPQREPLQQLLVELLLPRLKKQQQFNAFISKFMTFQIGMLLGTPFGPFIVHSPDTFTICNTSDPLPRSSPTFIDWEAKIHQQLLYYLLGQAILIFLLIPLSCCKNALPLITIERSIMFFIIGVPAIPSVPPSLSKQLQDRMKKTSIVSSVLDLLKNPYYVMLIIAFRESCMHA